MNLVNSLDIGGDDIDDVGAALNDAFGLTPGDWPKQRLETVGELEAWLSDRLAGVLDQDGACMTTMAFLRLRAVLNGEHRLKPSASLASLAGANPRRFHRDLSAATGLALPGFGMTRRGAWVAGLLLIGLPAGLIANEMAQNTGWVLAALASWPLMIAVIWTDRGRVPDDLATLGDLARQAVPLNYRDLAAQGGRTRGGGLWEAVTSLLGELRGADPAAINRETRLFATLH